MSATLDTAVSHRRYIVYVFCIIFHFFILSVTHSFSTDLHLYAFLWLFVITYTQRHKLSTTEHYFGDVFHKRIYSKEQSICYILLPKSFLGLSNLSECHWTLLIKFYGVLYTPTPILGYTLKSAIANPKVPPLNSYSRENELDLFLRLVPKWFCRT